MTIHRILVDNTSKLRSLLVAAALATAAVLGSVNSATAGSGAETSPPAQLSYRSVKVRGIDIAYREAGPATAPVVLLLHGFPSSSHMFRELIPALAGTYRVIAPDYPGFGYSGEPSFETFDYSFASLAALIGDFTEAVGAKDYVLYMQDYGGPVGFRLALAHPERVRGLVIQNATISVEGWNPDVVAQFKPFWTARSAETEVPVRGFLKPETTKWQYTQGASRADRLSPDSWTHDQVRLDRPGNDKVQLQYLFNYQDNVARYPAWQDYLKSKRPPMLIVWGKNDPFFTMAGVEALKALQPQAEVHLYDAGHFAFETHGPEIAQAMRAFLASLGSSTQR